MTKKKSLLIFAAIFAAGVIASLYLSWHKGDSICSSVPRGSIVKTFQCE